MQRVPNAAFDPSRSTYRPPEAIGPKPQPQARRSGPRPVPTFSTPQPLVTIGANNLFDRNPPRTASSTGYAEQTAYFLPRFLYLEITKKF